MIGLESHNISAIRRPIPQMLAAKRPQSDIPILQFEENDR